MTDDADALSQALFAPRGIALVGASDDPSKGTGRPLAFLRRHGFAGAIVPVNDRRATVQGLPAVRDVREAAGPVDHAFVLLADDLVPGAVEACCDAGVRVATVLAGTFGKDQHADARARARAADQGMRLLGPNSLGLVQPATGLVLTAGFAFDTERILSGSTTVLSQSGSLIGAVASRLAARGLGCRRLISVGNESDLSLAEIGIACVRDSETEVLLLLLETVRDAETFERMCRAAHRAGKPVLAYYAGRTEAGEAAAAGHTGVLSGGFAAVEAFLRDLGVALIDSFDGVLEALPLFTRGRDATREGDDAVAVVTTTGGGGVLVADALGRRGVAVRGADAALAQALSGEGIAIAPGGMIDLTMAGARPDVYGRAIDAALELPGTGAVVAVVGSSAVYHPELVVAPIVERQGAARPLVAFVIPQADAALARLASAQIAAFRTPEACAAALAAFFERCPPRDLPPAAAPVETTEDPFDLARQLGLAVLESHLLGGDESSVAGLPFSPPVAVKAYHPEIAHKSDWRGVILGVTDIAAAVAQVRATIAGRAPGLGPVPVLIQPMCEPGVEMIVGYRRDARVGPVVMVGAGGVAAELMRDIRVRRAPVDAATAREMVDGLACRALLDGYRGAPAADIEALADAIVRVSALTSVDMFEINPLIVGPTGAVAVDARMARRLT